MPSKDDVIEALKTIIDPEIFIDIWTLGLIYDISFAGPEGRLLNITMTFTSPACPAGPQLAYEVRAKTEDLDGIDETNVQVVFDPPWQPSEELKALMGIG